jgi:hypothetical protein
MTGLGARFFLRTAMRGVLLLMLTLPAFTLVSAGQVDGVSEEVPPDTPAEAPVVPLADRVDVLYFHRTIRCATCLTFERYAHEALLEDYPDELASGRLTWSVLNFEEEANAELVGRYDVFESSLVVSSVRDSGEVAWDKLEAIWGFVSDKDTFTEYVSSEVDTAERMVVDGGVEQEEGAVPVHR